MTLEEIIATLPASCTIKELPRTNQLLVYGSSDVFNQAKIAAISQSYGNYETACFKRGGWNYTNLLLINNYGLSAQPIEKNEAPQLIALKVLATYAHKKETDRIDILIENESHSAYNDSYGNSDFSEKIKKNMQDYLKVTNNGLMQHISSFKKLTKQQQRQEIYATCGCLGTSYFGDKITASAAEMLLREIANIAEEPIDFIALHNERVIFPQDKIIEKDNALIPPIPRQSPVITVSSSRQSLFCSTPVNSQEIKIGALNLNIEGFNQTYQGQYAITQRGHFWDVLDLSSKKICGHFYNANGELVETPFSKGAHHFTNHILRHPVSNSSIGYSEQP
ncbi:MAG: hypothetical protein WC785_08660 [Tatlockia sp.]|jgi:hypothetical protein